MTRIQNVVILLIILLFNGSCASKSSPPPKDHELVKRLNRINEILDEIDTNPYRFRLHASIMSDYYQIKEILVEDCRLLIENPDIALPLMFERLNNKKFLYKDDTLPIYFIVFERTKSAESIPYISNCIASVVSDDETKYAEDTKPSVETGSYDCFPQDVFGCAIFAAQNITHPLKFIDVNRTFYEQRLDMANQLRQWYAEYKKNQDKK
jgi:hypothetical protein